MPNEITSSTRASAICSIPVSVASMVGSPKWWRISGKGAFQAMRSISRLRIVVFDAAVHRVAAQIGQHVLGRLRAVEDLLEEADGAGALGDGRRAAEGKAHAAARRSSAASANSASSRSPVSGVRR